jgi:SAM-dependent methyltransferase
MLAVARRRNPRLRFAAGDLVGVPARAASCAGAVVFWVLHHVRRADLPAVLRELRRILATGAPLLLATHAGPGLFTGTGIDGAVITGTLYADDELERALIRAGFAVDAVRHREPLAHERQGDRVYVSATAV